MPNILGLTGGIGSGKSTVARLLAERGAHVVDADRTAHEIYAPGTEGFDRVVERFGRGVVGSDGAVDRNKLGGLVFGDQAALEDLNAIVHPLVRSQVAGLVAGYLQEDPDSVVVIEAALMTETGWSGGAGKVWTVVADPDIALQRLVTVREMEPEEARLRMASQMDNAARRASASLIIENNGSLDDLEAAVEGHWQDLQASADHD